MIDATGVISLAPVGVAHPASTAHPPSEAGWSP